MPRVRICGRGMMTPAVAPLPPQALAVAPLSLEVLSPLLPAPEETLLLRALLLSGAQGSAAWERWYQSIGGDLKAFIGVDTRGLKRLLPLLYGAVRRNGVAVDGETLTYLRTAYAREAMRGETYRRLARDILAPLATAGIPTIVLKGAALAGTVYGDWAVRHCHDLDLLVHQRDLARAGAALRAAGVTAGAMGGASTASDAMLAHRHGLPVALHTRLFPLSYYNADLADVWARRRAVTIADAPAHILSPVDSLLHLCGHASCSASRATLRWACDAWYLVEQSPDLDWDGLVSSVCRRRLGLPFFLTLRYLALELGAPIPAAVLEELGHIAAHTDLAGYEAALLGLRMSSRARGIDLLRRAPGWRARAIVLKWLLFPSPAHLARRQARLLPLYYGYRLARYSGRYARRVVIAATGRGRVSTR